MCREQQSSTTDRTESSDGAIPAIAEYGLIGDTRTAALVSASGAIDWMCAPRFDGQPLFGRLIGGADAGTFAIGPSRRRPPRNRCYHAGSATLETVWEIDDAVLTLTEAMIADVKGRLLPGTLVVRRLVAEGAPINVVVDFDPRFGESHRVPRIRRCGGLLVCSWGSTAVGLRTWPASQIEPGLRTEVTVSPGQPITFALAVADREPLVDVDPDAAWTLLIEDEARWRRWTSAITDVPYRDEVVRSLLTLRLLTYSPSGAPVAAPTTSLPEVIGGVRNWDYRFAWPRDASIGIGAFLGVGKTKEARQFMAWLLHASRLDRPRLPVLLSLHGKHPRRERELVGWPGYEGSTPVLVGNGAADQHQLDGYGWVLDAGWLLTRAGHPPYSETWRALSGFADRVAERWTQPDAGIWEVRGDAAHHVHSKLMAWLALDRALRVADRKGVSGRRRRRWLNAREAIATEITTRGFDARRGTYTRSYGSADVDASLLILPLLGIESPDSPRVRGTIAAIEGELGAGGPLLYRYPPGADGLEGTEGVFLPCSFWLIQALANIGEIDRASQLFAEMVSMASPLGLYAEEMDPSTKAHLGNYPQALTHAALVQAALALRDAVRRQSDQRA